MKRNSLVTIAALIAAMAGMIADLSAAPAPQINANCQLIIGGKTVMQGICNAYYDDVGAVSAYSNDGMMTFKPGGVLTNKATNQCLMAFPDAQGTAQVSQKGGCQPNVFTMTYLEAGSSTANTGYFRVRNNSVWGLGGCLKANGTTLAWDKCDNQQTAQLWGGEPAQDGNYKIRNMASGSNWCLDVINNKVTMAFCNPNTQTQYWR